MAKNMIDNGNVEIFSASDLPSGFMPTTSTTINGHIKYENVYIRKPAAIVSSASLVEVPPGSNNFYKVKPEQYVINSSWSEKRLKEEIAFALAHRVLDPTRPPTVGAAQWGRPSSEVHIASQFNSQFTDGTPIGIIHQNYGQDVVTNAIYDDHICLIYIK